MRGLGRSPLRLRSYGMGQPVPPPQCLALAYHGYRTDDIFGRIGF